MANIKLYFRMLKLYGKFDIHWFLRDFKYALVYTLADLVASFAKIMGVFLLAVRLDGFSELSQAQLVFMLSYALVVDGLYNLFFISSNMGEISRVIGRGQMDHLVIQPVPLVIQFITAGFAPATGSSTFVAGIIFMSYTLRLNRELLTLFRLLLLLIFLFCSLIITVSMVYLVSVSAFYQPVASEEIAGEVLSLSDLKSYPLGGFPKSVKGLLVTVLPIGLGAWLPTKLLFAPFHWSFIFLPIMTAFFLIITALFFRKGMKYYATNGSPRYTGFGHR